MPMLLDRDRGRFLVEQDERRWSLAAADARDGVLQRRAFRNYLEQYGDRAGDFDAAEALYGELVGNCVRHAPGRIVVEFNWDDRTLVVTDARERLRSWPFSPDDPGAEATHHSYALINAFTARIHLTRDAAGGTRASVLLPVARAGR